MSREPTVGADANNWGTVLNDFLTVSHNTDGTPKTALPSAVSGSMNTYTGSGATGQAVLTVGTHDFQIGHGIRVYGGGNLTDANTPPTPTVTTAGTPGATAYQYQIASCLSAANSTADAMSVASTAGTIGTGNAALSVTNYNKVAWAPGSTQQGYAVYGRTAGSKQLLGYVWYVGPVHAAVALVAGGNAPPFLGANLSISTQYTYAFTGTDFMGNETPTLYCANGFHQNAVTTAGSVTGIALTWDYYNGAFFPYQKLNIYRATGAGALQFLAQVDPFEKVYNDYGLTAQNAGQTPPTTLTFVDNGQLALTGTAGRPAHIPVAPPVAATNSSLYTTVSAISATTVTLNANITNPGGVASARVAHDDSGPISAALAAYGTVTLPNGYYPIHRQLTVPAGGTLTGQASAVDAPVTVTTTTNPNPNPGNANLCFYANQPNQQLLLNGHGASVRKVGWFWPEQSNGTLAGLSSAGTYQSVIPFPPSVYCQFGSVNLGISDIYDANSWVGMHMPAAAGIIERFWCGFLLFEILCEGGEPILSTFKSDPGSVYSGNVNLPAALNRTCIRGISGANLAIMDNVAVDYCTPIWWTTGNTTQGGAGQFGTVISNVWTDDFRPCLVLDAPVSDCWSTGGQTFVHRVSNFYGVPGAGTMNITTGYTALANGTNDAKVHLANCQVPGTAVNLTGQLHFSAVGCSLPIINSNAVSAWLTPLITIALGSTALISTTRINTQAGATKAYITGCYTSVGVNGIADTVTGGTLYVIDEQATYTERFGIPTGTVLGLGDNTIGHLVMPGGVGNGYLYVISVAATGSSATDVWKLNGTALVTTSAALSGGLRNGAAGEGHGSITHPITTALYTLANTNGSGCIVLPVVLNAAAGLTTAAPLECRITYCLTPMTA